MFERMNELSRESQIFFVCGAPKTGTTWLQKALNAHPAIVCAGEGHFIDRFAAELAPLFKRYLGHQAVVDRNVYEGNGFYRHDRYADFDLLLRVFVLNAFSRVERPSGTLWVGDKTPANVRHLDVLHRLFPEAKFIHMMRDGRDTLVSTLKHAERVTRDQAELDELVSSNLRSYCLRWVEAVEASERFAAGHPGAIHTVRYEDLKSDFPTAFGSVLRFLGADAGEDAVSHCMDESSFKRLSGGREPGQEDASKFVRKGIVGDWKGALSPEQLAVFMEVAGSWLARLGYLDEDGDTDAGQ